MKAEHTETKPRVEISKKLVLINSASSVITRLLSISVLIWLQQYLLKRITPEEYSLLPVLYSVMMFAPLVTTILTGGLGRYIVEAYARDDDERVTQIVSTMFPILCAAGVVLLSAGWTFAWYIDSVLNVAPRTPLGRSNYDGHAHVLRCDSIASITLQCGTVHPPAVCASEPNWRRD